MAEWVAAVRGAGARVRDRWRASGHATEALPEIAVAELATVAAADVDLAELVGWLAMERELPPQADPDALFSDLPVTLYADERLHVDVLVWLDGTTCIHDHSFSGAFAVLAGASLHSSYAFAPKEVLDGSVQLGELTLRRREVLRRGDVRAIRGNRETIHALFHLDRPTLSLVLRTFEDPGAGAQFAYLPAGIAYEPDGLSERTKRLSQALTVTFGVDRGAHREIARSMVAEADPASAFHLCLKLAEHFSPAEHARFLDSIERSQPRVVPYVRRALPEYLRAVGLVARRARVQHADHRFLLALLLNVQTRDEVLAAVASRFPASEPEAIVMGWLRAMSGPAGGLEDLQLGESELDVLEQLVAGRDDDGVIEGLRRTYSSDELAESEATLRELCAAFRASEIFGPLLAVERSFAAGAGGS